MRRRKFTQNVFVRRKNAGIVHKFAEPEHVVADDILFDILSVENGAARFKGRGGHAGGKLYFHVERDVFRGFHDIVHARHTADVGDFVRVGDDGRRTAGHDERGKLFGRKLGTFDVDVSVDIPGEYGKPSDIDLRFPLVVSDPDDAVAADRDISLAHFADEYVDVFSVFQHDIGFFLAQSRFNAVFDFFHSSSVFYLFIFHSLSERNRFPLK